MFAVFPGLNRVLVSISDHVTGPGGSRLAMDNPRTPFTSNITYSSSSYGSMHKVPILSISPILDICMFSSLIHMYTCRFFSVYETIQTRYL